MTNRNSLHGGARIQIATEHVAQSQRLGLHFEARGFRVASTENGALALEMARQQKPALVLSDVKLPEMNGYELCAQIKDDPKLADVPVILMTTSPDPQDVIRGLECRADDLLIEPHDGDRLLRRVQRALANSPVRRDERPDARLEIEFCGQQHFVTANRQQILNLLLSTCEAAIERNHELSTTRELLRETDAKLQALTRGLGDRRQAGIREVEQSNEMSRPAADPTAATARHAQPLFAARSLRVLLIDDDPSLIESLRSALQDEGHKVTAAGGGQAGIDEFREARKCGRLFDIVITDLAMPSVDGRQVIASIRGMSPATPIILLTGWGQHVANETDRPPQVDRLLGKPPRIRELRAALAELTGRRATDRTG